MKKINVSVALLLFITVFSVTSGLAQAKYDRTSLEKTPEEIEEYKVEIKTTKAAEIEAYKIRVRETKETYMAASEEERKTMRAKEQAELKTMRVEKEIEREENKEERGEDRIENKESRLVEFSEKLTERADRYFERISAIIAKVQTRIDTMEAEGRDVAAGQAKLDEASSKLAFAYSQAMVIVDSIENADISSEEGLGDVKSQVSGLKTPFREVMTLLKDAVSLLKGSSDRAE